MPLEYRQESRTAGRAMLTWTKGCNPIGQHYMCIRQLLQSKEREHSSSLCKACFQMASIPNHSFGSLTVYATSGVNGVYCFTLQQDQHEAG